MKGEGRELSNNKTRGRVRASHYGPVSRLETSKARMPRGAAANPIRTEPPLIPTPLCWAQVSPVPKEGGNRGEDGKR